MYTIVAVGSTLLRAALAVKWQMESDYAREQQRSCAAVYIARRKLPNGKKRSWFGDAGKSWSVRSLVLEISGWSQAIPSWGRNQLKEGRDITTAHGYKRLKGVFHVQVAKIAGSRESDNLASAQPSLFTASPPLQGC